jgi:uncharacterized protein (DUF342 family)
MGNPAETPKKEDSQEDLKEIFKNIVGDYAVIGRATPDSLKLFLDIEPAVQPPPPLLTAPSNAQVLGVLKENGVGTVSNPEILEDMLKEVVTAGSSRRRRVSRGIPPVIGRDGKLVYLVKRLGSSREVKVDDTGKADFLKVHLFDNISQGQIVARIYPPKPGIPGRDIFGKEVPAQPGKPVELKPDETLEEGDEDGRPEYKVLRSKVSGCLTEDGDKIKVQHELVISGDLDYRFGTLDFIGKVTVTGDVMPGFNITAHDGIEVKGSVRGGSLVALKGPIKVDGYVYGGAGSRVISGDSFTASIVQEINAEIRGDINILKEARDSYLRSESTINIPTGHMYGGKALVVCGLDCGTLGSEVEATTLVEFVGDLEATVAFSQLQMRILNHEKASDLLKLHLGPLASNRARIDFLKPDYKAKVMAVVQKYDKVESSLKVLRKRRLEMQMNSKSNNVKRVNIHKKLFPGTKIQVKEFVFAPRQPISGPVSLDFDESRKEFVQGELKGLECSYKSAAEASEGSAAAGDKNLQ